MAQYNYCLKYLHNIIDLWKWAPLWLSLALKNTVSEYFTPCLKFDDSSQLCVALRREPTVTLGIIPRGRSAGALQQEPVCLVQTEGVTHQVVQVTFSKLLV